jgi:hypothetical protein
MGESARAPVSAVIRMVSRMKPEAPPDGYRHPDRRRHCAINDVTCKVQAWGWRMPFCELNYWSILVPLLSLIGNLLSEMKKYFERK